MLEYGGIIWACNDLLFASQAPAGASFVRPDGPLEAAWLIFICALQFANPLDHSGTNSMPEATKFSLTGAQSRGLAHISPRGVCWHAALECSDLLATSAPASCLISRCSCCFSIHSLPATLSCCAYYSATRTKLTPAPCHTLWIALPIRDQLDLVPRESEWWRIPLWLLS